MPRRAALLHEILWMRELLAVSYVPTFVVLDTPQGGIAAVTFVINRQSDRYVQLHIEETARLIATGRGAAAPASSTSRTWPRGSICCASTTPRSATRVSACIGCSMRAVGEQGNRVAG